MHFDLLDDIKDRLEDALDYALVAAAFALMMAGAIRTAPEGSELSILTLAPGAVAVALVFPALWNVVAAVIDYGFRQFGYLPAPAAS